MHVLPDPFGVLLSPSELQGDHQQADVLLSGLAGGYQDKAMTPGTLYYTNSFGELLSSQTFCGHEDTWFYAEDEATGTLATGLVGVAVSDSSLLLKL